MSRLGPILIPLLGGFLLTAAVVSWRSGWWEQRDVQSAAAPPRVAVRQSHLRVVHVSLSADPWAPATAAPAPAKAAAAPEPVFAPVTPPPVPRVDPGNSPELLEAPARKFARGDNPDGD